MPASPDSSVTSPLRTCSWAWLLATAVLVAFRTLPFAWWGTLDFDADQAVVGLMAQHIAEFRALPVYQYAFGYVLMVTAYVTAPFMWLLGPTPFALKLPLALMNVGVALGLVTAIVRAGLAPSVAVLLSLPVIVAAPVVNAGLMDALGMTVEPLLFVILLWHARRSPVLFGIIAAIGFHVREFVAYGVAAVLAVDVISGALATRARRRHWLVVAVAALGTSAVVGGVARFASVRGPGTWMSEQGSGNLATLGGAFCFAPAQAWRNVQELGASYLGVLWGASPVALSEAAVQSRLTQGLPWAWPVLALLTLALVFWLAFRWRALWRARTTALAQLGLFLVLVGLQAVLVYAVSRCGPLLVVTLRYALLGAFLPTGLVLLAWVVGPPRGVQRAIGATLVALAALNLSTHARLWHEQWRTPVVSNRAQLGPALEARGIRHARSDYWTAYYVVFTTQERVIVGADSFSRIDEYERILSRRAADVVRISTDPCGDEPAIVPGYHVCPLTAP